MINKKLLIASIVSCFALSSLFAQTTMCYKKDHKDFTTIENTKLDGGECAGKLSLKQMQKEGWTIQDIKIDNQNYLYILKKDVQLSSQSVADLEEQILQRLEAKQENSEEEAKIVIQDEKFEAGKKLYLKRCVSCHGEKGEKIYGLSRAINTLDEDEFVTTIRDYGLGEYDRGQAFVMLPFAVGKSDSRNIFLYLQSLNKNEAK